NYSDNEDYTYTFTAASGGTIIINFPSFLTENLDKLYLYDGAVSDANLIVTLSGSSYSGQTYVATSGVLTTVWHSDYSMSYGGWEAVVTNSCTVSYSGEISCGSNVSGSITSSGTPAVSALTSNRSRYLNGHIYTYTPEFNQTISLNFTTSGDGDPDLFVLGGSNLLGLPGGTEILTFSVTAGVNYTFYVANSSEGTGTYSINIPCNDRAVPSCESASGFCSSDGSEHYNISSSDENISTHDYNLCSFFSRPSWWWLRIDNPGDIDLTIHSSCGDVDFACWGPFPNVTCDYVNDLTNPDGVAYSYYSGDSYADCYADNCGNSPITSTTLGPICTTAALAYPVGNLVDFGGSTSEDEYLQLRGVQHGQIYMVVIANYSGCEGEIFFTQTNLAQSGSGTLDCTIVNDCVISSITTLPSECQGSGTFTVSGVVNFTDPPVDGTLTISDGSISQTFTPPFVSPISYELTGVQGDATEHTITASFSSSTMNCSQVAYYQAPDCIISCPDATASMNGTLENGVYYYDVCLGTGINMTGAINYTTNAHYATENWTWRINPHGGADIVEFSGQSVSFTPSAEQGYDIALIISDGSNCRTVANGRIRVSDGLTTNLSALSLGEICVGGSETITIGGTGSDIVVTDELHSIESRLGVAGETFIPDGTNCPEQCYTSSVTFHDFNEGALVTSVDDIEYLRVNMEHSFIGDLQIMLTCPNGRSAIVLQDYFSNDPTSENYSSDAIDPYSYTWPEQARTQVWYAGTSAGNYYGSDNIIFLSGISNPNQAITNDGVSYYTATFASSA
ncbi:MAG: hypothetical protein HUK15_04675, partial [Bacteroidales bacterium]|nr:hypothetical protein [Bacteroidales bacterium]